MRQYYASVELCNPEVMKDVSVGGGSEGMKQVDISFLLPSYKIISSTRLIAFHPLRWKKNNEVNKFSYIVDGAILLWRKKLR